MGRTTKRIARRLAATACVIGAMLARDAAALDLLKAYELALQQDAGFQALRAEAEAGREVLPQARAQLLPTVTASFWEGTNKTNSAAPGFTGAMSYSSREYDSSNYAISLKQPIYRKFNFAAYRQAEFQVQSIDATMQSSLQDVAVRVGGAYFDALLAEHQLTLVLAAKEAYAGQLASAKRSLEKGLGTRTDIDDAQARYDMAVAQELDAIQNVDFTRRQIQTLVNEPVDALAPLDARRIELVPPMPAKADEWITRAEETNNELAAMRANVEAARQEVEKARAGHHPTLDLVVQRSRNLSGSEQTINQFYLTTQVGVQMNMPLFAGGYVNSQVRQAQANLEKFTQQYEAKRREINLKVRKEFQNVSEGVLKVRALEQAERSADQAVYSNKKGFQAGVRTQIDILNAQQQLMNTRRDLAQARHDYILSRLRLQGLVGSLTEEEMRTVNAWLGGAGTVAAGP